MIAIDRDSDAPPFAQIRTQLSAAILDGRLRPGDRLPTVRGLADELGLAANTVARAYRELERAGVVETRGRAGTVVAGDQVETRARSAAAAYLAELESLGLGLDDAVDHLRRAHQDTGRSG